ncbi:class I SAM-dependent methyltransferase [Alteribacillus iranensis]|uniref:Site-specific DNA-methyltransferase (Adenine-specific) n=1 Tax=Alteribacillus iranensis TaxID=930128 RepID=A0A1I2CI91_9BACI|nr:class I SAM-dependent methyltransferase [Alteribacillus iranensis]SFE67984.1 site-specific DNA-methyltransferase (adenine-specific) [Alteribacillus iranensis]
MEPITDVEKLYTLVDDIAVSIQKHADKTYLEALAEAGEAILNQSVSEDLPREESIRLEKKITQDIPPEMEREGIRKAFQLAVIKGMKEAVQPHHAMTPDAVALFIGYLVDKLVSKKESAVILDPASGTGNLLSAVLNSVTKNTAAYGVEVDETLLHIAYVLADLQEHQVEFFHQDAIEQLAVPPVDVVAADLPVGYYPKDEVAQNFELKSSKGRSYVHHLIIEKCMEHVKDGGFFVLLIPNFMFESEEAPALNKYIKEHATTLGLLQLPESMFKSNQYGKSIWMLQKKGKDAIQPSQALFAELPSFVKHEALADMIVQIDKWFKEQGLS